MYPVGAKKSACTFDMTFIYGVMPREGISRRWSLNADFHIDRIWQDEDKAQLSENSASGCHSIASRNTGPVQTGRIPERFRQNAGHLGRNV